MSNGGKFLSCLAGLTIGATLTYCLLKNSDENNDSESTGNLFDKLLQNQFVCNEVNGSILTEWFQKEQHRVNQPTICYLAKPTNEMLKLFDIQRVPSEFDREHYLIQAIITKEKYQVKSIRFVNYISMSETLKGLFGEKDYIILQGGNEK